MAEMTLNMMVFADAERKMIHSRVQEGIDGENKSYEPRVDANQFLTVAKQLYGLNPPD